MNRYKPRKILEEGTVLGKWACDIGENGLESNGGDEHLIEWDNEYFTIVTSVYSGKILGWRKLDKENELLEGGFVADYIKEYEGVK